MTLNLGLPPKKIVTDFCGQINFIFIWQTGKHVLFSFFRIFEAIAREYFPGACDHFLELATEVQGTVRLIFVMELLTLYSIIKVGD